MKIFLVFFLLAASRATEDVLRSILRSPKATLQLYGEFKTQQHLNFLSSEDRMRFRLFRSNAQLVAQSNEEGGSAVFGLNFFSAMTADEKQQYLGINITGHENEHDENPIQVPSSLSESPISKLWTNEGMVTKVKNQGSCGSCWTFAAVGGLETRYRKETGVLRNFAEQEYLDCVYEGTRDGCSGGWPDDPYKYSAKYGRLASTAHYEYDASDNSCKRSSKPDALIAAKITGHTRVGRNWAAHIAALTTGSLSLTFQVTEYFNQYTSGIIQDRSCTGRSNHGVSAVGYTPTYMLVKNSWGSSWGENGFVKFARGYDGKCGLLSWSYYPNLRLTGQSDTTPSDAATGYRADDHFDPHPDPSCKDRVYNCQAFHCPHDNIAVKYCNKTCNKCCPSGTVRCPDLVCRHEHMC